MKVSTSVHFLGNLYRGIYWILWSDIVKFCTTIFFFYITQYTCMHIKCIVKIKGHFFKLHFRVKWRVNQMDKVLLYSSVFYWLQNFHFFFNFETNFHFLILKQSLCITFKFCLFNGPFLSTFPIFHDQLL